MGVFFGFLNDPRTSLSIMMMIYRICVFINMMMK